ncbi:MAG: biotin/lipoyl-containing protein [Chloroherpetonaceae bacterium]|nr:acetyl-CoA carboxylase biotin carboxyl carrier protein subunit [Chthonomonadaceae bacterium]MDW8206466.1 biotin/lipoyl-containing protein [Chloroherpetonaceae bacterium]
MKLAFHHHDRTLQMEAHAEGDGYRVRLPDGHERSFTARRLSDGRILLSMHTAEGTMRVLRVPVSRTERGIEICWHGNTFLFTPAAGQAAPARSARESGRLTAPMVGVVAAVLVSPGDPVQAYQPLVVVEAMKVMTTIDAPFAGIVQAVHVQPGERVAHGALVVEIAPVDNGA